MPESLRATRPERFLKRVEAKCADYRASGPIVIVALGDSVTMGATSQDRLEPDAVYHHRVKAMLEGRYPKAVFSVINSGTGGDSAADGLKRIGRDVLRYEPDLTLVAFGLNDASDEAAKLVEYRANLTRIVGAIRGKTTSDIVLLTPSFMCSRDSENVPTMYRSLVERFIHLQCDGYLGRFAQVVRDVGAEFSLPVADVYAAWEQLARSGVDTTAMLANGLNHPTGEAQRIAAEAVMKAILS